MTDDITNDLALLDDWLAGKGYGEEAGLCLRAMDLIRKQADEIEKLRAERDECERQLQNSFSKIGEILEERNVLRAALKPFAEQVDRPVNIYEHDGVRMEFVDHDVLDRLCRAAKAALEGE